MASRVFREAKWSTLRERFVLTNKGDAELDRAELKGRWIFGGHRDPDAIHFEAQVLDFVWRCGRSGLCIVSDVSAVFSQGESRCQQVIRRR